MSRFRLHSGIAALVMAPLVASGSMPTKAQAQTAPPPATGTPPARQTGTIVSGFVHDSLSGRSLIGAAVQLVPNDAGNTFSGTMFSDSSGKYTFADVPDGKYTLGFYHPLLDSLGMEAYARVLSVNRQGAIRADMSIPPATRMRDVLCGPREAGSAGGVVIGTVLNAADRKPVKDVRVVGQWFEVSIGTGGVTRRNPRKVATSNDGGMFLLCDVPNSGALSLLASRGADSTGTIEVEVPQGGFLRSELYLGESMTVANALDTIAKKDTLTLRTDAVHVGTMRLTGTVIAIDGGDPMPNAVVGITNGPQTRTNERGQWTITNAPSGSHTLEVRAVGKYPVKRNVNIINGVAPIRVAMSTFKAMLDTLKVTAGLSSAFDLREFEQRRKSQGMGRFLTADDIYKRAILETSQIFRNFPGMDLQPSDTGTLIVMKGVFGTDMCQPTIYLNGTPMNGITGEELDNMVRPERIIGVEVYSATSMPAQFQNSRLGCGSVVIWQRP